MPFVGRTAELERLVGAVRAAPALVMVSGEAGLGKSRLIDEAVKALPADQRALLGRCRRLRDPFPLGPVADAIRGVGDALARRGLLPIAGAVRPLVPEIAEYLPPRPEQSDDRDVQRHQLFRGLVAVLRGLGPLVLVVEDAQWADRQTVEFVDYLLDDPLPDLAVVVTYRPAEASPSVPGLAARSPADLAVERVELEPWDIAGTGQMAAAILEADEVSDEFATYLCDRASGIPLAVQEMTALLVEQGAVELQDGEWVRRAIDELDVPAGIRDAVLERVAMLDEPTTQVITAAATLQVPATGTALQVVTGLAERRFTDAVERAQASGLISESEAGFEMVHALAAQAVHDSLTPAARRQLHRRAAEALRALQDPPLGQIAHHLRQSGQVVEWIEVSEVAAEQAQIAGNEEEAANQLEPLLREAALNPDQRVRVAKALARVSVFSPRAAELIALLESVVDGDPDLRPADLAELQIMLAMLMGNTGGAASRRDALLDAALRTEAIPAEQRVEASVLSCGRYLPGTSRHDLCERLERVTGLLPQIADADVALKDSNATASELLTLGAPRWQDVVRQPVGPPTTRAEFVACFYLADGALDSGHLELAGRLVSWCLDVEDEAIAQPTLMCVVAAQRSYLDFISGHWKSLTADIRRQRGAMHTPEVTRAQLRALAAALELSRRGPSAELAAELDELVGHAMGSGSLVLVSRVLPLRLRVTIGRDESSLPRGMDFFAATAEAGMVVPHMFRVLPDAAAALAAVGDAESAGRLTERFGSYVKCLDSPLVRPALQHARGNLAAAAGQWSEAGGLLIDAGRLYAAASVSYEAARAAEAAAQALVSAGDRAVADDQLRAAVETYERLEADWDLDRATSFGRRHDLSVPSRHRRGSQGYGDDLTPRERQVAELAADGLTNREIADHLYVSVNTVNKQLRGVLRKLGLDSRRELRGGGPRQPGGDPTGGMVKN